jgi:3-phenylpropionate/trans-cinnamate dioxygenase ferredoxin component
MKRIQVEGYDILLANVEGNYYAIGNRCPHLGSNLSGGPSRSISKDGRIVRWVEGSGVVSKIVRSLKSPKSPAVYKVKLEDEKIFVET